MKHTITISPIKGTAGGYLRFDKITKNGVDYMILRNQEVIVKDKAKPSDEPLMVHITQEHGYNFNYDDDPKNQDNKNAHRMKMAELIPYHHQVVMTDFKNPNSGAVLLYEFEDSAMNHQRNFNTLALLRNATNKVWDMSFQEKMNVMYFYGKNPAGMGHKELTIRLTEPSFGVVLQRTPFGNTGYTILEHFVKEYQGGDEVQSLKTNILKATLLTDYDGKLIMKKEGNAFVFGTSIIGSNVDEACVWLNNNPEKKNYLIKCVQQHDRLDFDDLDVAMAAYESGKDEITSEIFWGSESDIRARAKSLKIEQAHIKKIDNLKAEIPLAEKVWSEAKALGLTPIIESSRKPMFLKDIKALIEKTKKNDAAEPIKAKELSAEEKAKLVAAV